LRTYEMLMRQPQSDRGVIVKFFAAAARAWHMPWILRVTFGAESASIRRCGQLLQPKALCSPACEAESALGRSSDRPPGTPRIAGGTPPGTG